MHTAARFPLERVAVFDRAIRAGEYPNVRTIADRLEVSRRTIQRDVEFLRDRLGAPLVFDAKRNGYAYADPSFRLSPVRLTEGELIALFVGERVLQTYKGTPFADDLARAFRKITEALDDTITIDLSQIGEAYSFRASAEAPFDPAVVRDLAVALAAKRRVRLGYWSASTGEETSREVDPYHLACVDSAWYLVAYCHLRREVRMFAPIRIRSIAMTESTFDRPADFRASDYLSGSFSVIRGGEGESHLVRLRFSAEAAKYVRERVWHPTQTLEPEPDGGLAMTVRVSHLREIERFVMSWGSDCEAMAPPELRDRLSRHFSVASAFYLPIPSVPDKHANLIDGRTDTPRPRQPRTR